MALCLSLGSLFLLLVASGDDRSDIIFADFEAETYGEWKATGEAFGPGPARGTLPNQMPVEGFVGKGLVNSYFKGDGTIGTLTSPEFKIERKFVRFLIGGGGYEGKTCLNLVIDGKTVRTATGPNTEPGGSERLEEQAWDVAELAGKSARLVVVDDATGGWGHVNVDQIVFTDKKSPTILSRVTREIVAEKRLLHFPVKNGGKKRNVSVSVAGREERKFEIELADGQADWWAPLDISSWRGQSLVITVDKLADDSQALKSVSQDDELRSAADLYREPLRPQLHFSPRRGWTNDPNGLVFFDGEYHLFFQHNPYGWNWGNMHWGHAVSKDLVHWEERAEALYPDAMGPMFSGSAVVDWQNTSGLGREKTPPLVLIYTAAGSPTVQCLASSADKGHTWTKFAGNPVLRQITPGNRDPKVIWHEQTKRWVMVLYVAQPKQGGGETHTIEFQTSPNLRDWTYASKVEGFYECPDFFKLAVDGDPAKKKWVLTAASSEYMVGSFDGRTFTPETPKLPGHRGRGFYAPQTFSDIPAADGRRIQIGWLQAPSPGMSFNQAMSLPLELTLRSTADGPRLSWLPVKELQSLRGQFVRLTPEVGPGDPNPLDGVTGDVLELRAECTPGDATEIQFTLRGILVTYDVKKQELDVHGHRAPAPLRDGKQQLIIYVDRTSIEVFAGGGHTYVPLPTIPKDDDRGATLTVKGGKAKFQRLEAYQLKSIWGK